MSNNERVERELSLYDMLWTTLEKWRLMVVLMIASAIVLVIYGYGNNKSIVAQNQEAERILAENAAAEAEPKDTTVDISELTLLEQEKVAMYLELREDYKRQSDYNNHSVLMNLDYQNIPKVTVQFHVEWADFNEDEQSKNNELVKVLRGKLRTILNGQEMKEAVGQVVTDENYAPYLNECTDTGNTTNKVTEESLNVFAFSVVAPTEEQAKEVAAKAIELVQKEYDRVAEELGSFEFKLISNEYASVMDVDLLTYQKNNNNNLVALNNSMKGVGDSMNAKQKQYLYQTTNGEVDLRTAEAPAKTDAQAGDTAADGTEALVIKPTVSLVLWGIGGIVAGILLTFVVAVVAYLNNKKLRLYNVVSEEMGMHSMQTVFSQDLKAGNIFDSVIFKLRYRNVRFFEQKEALELICADIRTTAVNKNVNQIYISCYDVDKEKNIVENIKKELSDSGMNINYGRSILYDAKALSRLAESQAVVFIEECNKTMYKELQKEMELCRARDIFVMGMIAQVSK